MQGSLCKAKERVHKFAPSCNGLHFGEKIASFKLEKQGVQGSSVCRVPFAKPGKESMDIEVFGMAGVPEGAVPGAPPPDGKKLFHGLRKLMGISY